MKLGLSSLSFIFVVPKVVHEVVSRPGGGRAAAFLLRRRQVPMLQFASLTFNKLVYEACLMHGSHLVCRTCLATSTLGGSGRNGTAREEIEVLRDRFCVGLILMMRLTAFDLLLDAPGASAGPFWEEHVAPCSSLQFPEDAKVYLPYPVRCDGVRHLLLHRHHGSNVRSRPWTLFAILADTGPRVPHAVEEVVFVLSSDSSTCAACRACRACRASRGRCQEMWRKPHEMSPDG